MAAVTFDDEPAKPPVKGGAVTFDDAAPAVQGPAPAFSDAPQAAPDRTQELRGEALRRYLAERGEPGHGTRFLDQLNWGLGRPLRGVIDAVKGEIGENVLGTEKPATFGERYRGATQAQGDYVDRARQNTNPLAGMGTDIAGSVAGAIPTMAISGPALLGQGLRTGANAGINAGRWALNSLWPVAESAVQGGVQGAANNAGTTVADAAAGGAKGAAEGAASSGILGALLNRLGVVQGATRSVGEATRGPDAAALRAQAQPLYDQLRTAQAGFDANQMGQLRTELQTALQGQGYTPGGTHGAIAPIYDALTSRNPTPFTSTAQGPGGREGLKEYYEQLGALAGNVDPSVRNIANRLRQTMDDFFETTTPAHNPNNLDIANIWPQARDLWRRNKRFGEMEWKGDVATNAADMPNTSQTVADKLRTMANATVNKVNKPDTYQPFEREQLDILNRMREGGGAIQRTLQGIGNTLTAPTDWALARGARAINPILPGGLGALFGVGATKLQGDPATAAMLGGGTLAALTAMRMGGNALKTAAGEYAQRDLDTLLRNISTGSSRLPDSVNLDRGTLATLFARSLAQRTGGALAADIGTDRQQRDRTLDDAEQLRLGARKLVP